MFKKLSLGAKIAAGFSIVLVIAMILGLLAYLSKIKYCRWFGNSIKSLYALC